ncbi:MAG TPA: BON domain-containing protein [Spongiibacteraceae bacterium]|nr:BON domain-containing protein [Spongiibacteraceae bacterium]
MAVKKFANSIFVTLPLAALLLLSGCTAIMTGTNDKPIEEDPGRRSLGSMIDDEAIETTATVNIRKTDSGLEHANVVVTSYNGVVLLSGQVPSEELRSAAAQAASLVKNVRLVHNHLSVGENTGFAARSADTLITTKLKAKLLTAANIKDSRVKVVTENGTVFLLGMVTREEANIAGKIAQNTDGVQKVVLLFEYIN